MVTAGASKLGRLPISYCNMFDALFDGNKAIWLLEEKQFIIFPSLVNTTKRGGRRKNDSPTHKQRRSDSGETLAAKFHSINRSRSPINKQQSESSPQRRTYIMRPPRAVNQYRRRLVYKTCRSPLTAEQFRERGENGEIAGDPRGKRRPRRCAVSWNPHLANEPPLAVDGASPTPLMNAATLFVRRHKAPSQSDVLTGAIYSRVEILTVAESVALCRGRLFMISGRSIVVGCRLGAHRGALTNRKRKLMRTRRR